MAFSLKINDIDWTANLVSKSLRISDNINGNSIASFRMKGETGDAFYPLQGQKVEICDFNGTLAFGGQIDEIEEEKIVGSQRIYYGLQCVDWHCLTDKDWWQRLMRIHQEMLLSETYLPSTCTRKG